MYMCRVRNSTVLNGVHMYIHTYILVWGIRTGMVGKGEVGIDSTVAEVLTVLLGM